ncbi:MAG: PHB depolymerase family esterase [Crocinitomicaceae bacterium]
MNIKRILTFAAVLSLSFQSFGQQTINASITHDGGQRDYIVYLPASYDGTTAFPLLMCFHGYTSSNSVIMSYSNFNAIADTADFIAVYPQGTVYGGSTHWNVGGWTTGSTVDDVGFVDALLDTLDQDYNINSDRVYSTGMSNGGFMSFLLACQLSDRIAAIASITGSMTPQTYNACNPQHPTPVLQIHGDADGTVPYNGDTWTESIPDVLAYWSNYNNNAMPDTTSVPDINSSDGSTVDHIQYGPGDNCTFVEHYKVYGGDHDWPGVWGNMDIHASRVAWNFLQRFDINGIAGCAAGIADETPQPAFTVYPNPTTEKLTLDKYFNTTVSYRILDVSGRLVGQGSVAGAKPVIDVSFLDADFYILDIEGHHINFVVSQ